MSYAPCKLLRDYTVVIAPPGEDRVFFHHPGCNDTFALEDMDLSALKEARLLHLGYPNLMRNLYENDGAELVRIFRAAKEFDLTVSLDVAMPDPASASGKRDWGAFFKEVLPYVDVYLPSFEESLMMLDPKEFDSFSSVEEEEQRRLTPGIAQGLAETFLGYGAQIVGIKCGALGYYLRTGPLSKSLGKAVPQNAGNWRNREISCAAYRPERFLSTTGAGDASIAGFLAGLLRGYSIERTVNCACAVGAQNVRALDATGGVGTWEETLTMVDGGWERLPAPLDKAWRFEAGGRVWLGPNDSPPGRCHLPSVNIPLTC